MSNVVAPSLSKSLDIGHIPFPLREKTTRMDAEGEEAFFEVMDQGFHVFEGFLWVTGDGLWSMKETELPRLPASMALADVVTFVVPACARILEVFDEYHTYAQDLRLSGQFSEKETRDFWDKAFAHCFESIMLSFGRPASLVWWHVVQTLAIDLRCLSGSGQEQKIRLDPDHIHVWMCSSCLWSSIASVVL